MENRFKEARTKNNRHGAQSTKEVEKETGVTKSLIEDIESTAGKPRNVGYLTVKKLAQHYGVSADYLLGLSGTPSTKEDIKVACKTTGLSEQAIEELRSKTCDTPSSIFIIPELNDLLISPKFWDFLYYLSLYRTQCSAAQSRPKLAENAKNPEDAARYRREGRKAVEDKDLFLFQMQKLLFSIASDVEKGCERRD